MQRNPVYMRHVCVDLLDATRGLAVCRSTVSFTWVYRDGIWNSFIKSEPLLAVGLCWAHRCLGSWVLLGLFCLLRVTHSQEDNAISLPSLLALCIQCGLPTMALTVHVSIPNEGMYGYKCD